MDGNQASDDQTVVEIVNRIRVLESKYTQLGERVLVINQNLIEQYKRLTKEIRGTEASIKDLKNDLNNVKNILKHLTEEASDFAKKDSLKVLEKYINLWNPLNFVTESDVKRIIKENASSTNSGSPEYAETGDDKGADSLSSGAEGLQPKADKRGNKPGKHKNGGGKSNARG
ncbi:MAG: hypothetical protein ABIB71_00725 [Candidatus Woesearchaeota archaeon]